ncbi:MAG TPA: phosphorylase [Methyloceanibacter sp.]
MGREPSFVLAVTGLRAEARIAERSEGVEAVSGGADSARLEKLITKAIEDGADALISFGIAAGLAWNMDAGTCAVGRNVVHDGASYAADPVWSGHIKSVTGVAELVTIAGVDQPLRSQAEKTTLHDETGAAAGDMESHVVARLAVKHELPFAVLRAVADPVNREIPEAALAGMSSDGSVNIGGVLVSIAREPSSLRALVRLAADTRLAMGTLFRCHDLLGSRLGYRDIG